MEWSKLDDRHPLWVRRGRLPSELISSVHSVLNDQRAEPRWLADGPALTNNTDGVATPALAALEGLLVGELGLTGILEVSWRHIVYGVGQGHPPHDDLYERDGVRMVASILMGLRSPAVGGQTVFGHDGEAGWCVDHMPGQVLYWHNVDEHGRPPHGLRHRALPVGAGTKEVLLGLVWSKEPGVPPAPVQVGSREPLPATVRNITVGAPVLDVASGAPAASACPGLFVVSDGEPLDTVRALQAACTLRGVPFWRLKVSELQDPHVTLPPGSLLYNPSISARGRRIEERLWNPGVAHLHGTRLGPLEIGVVQQRRVWELQGVRTPRTLMLHRSDRESVLRALDGVGGLPALLRFENSSGGEGIVWVDSLRGLFSSVDHAFSRSEPVELVEYVPDAAHWRVVVVDGAVVGTQRSTTRADDFRSMSSDDPADVHADPPPQVLELALEAVSALGQPAAGVDVLHSESGVWVLEANFPFYFGHLQRAGHDVAGALVEALLRRMR